MKFLVKNPIFDTKTSQTYHAGEVFDVTDKRLEGTTSANTEDEKSSETKVTKE